MFTASLADPRAHGLVIYGPAGVGKTRLADQCLAIADEAGRRVARATATAGARNTPLGALAHLLPPDLGDERCDLVAVVAAVRPVLLADATNGPLVLFVDDLHAARPSVGGAHRAARRCRPRLPGRHRPNVRTSARRPGIALASRPRASHRSRRSRPGGGRHVAPPRAQRPCRGERRRARSGRPARATCSSSGSSCSARSTVAVSATSGECGASPARSSRRRGCTSSLPTGSAHSTRRPRRSRHPGDVGADRPRCRRGRGATRDARGARSIGPPRSTRRRAQATGVASRTRSTARSCARRMPALTRRRLLLDHADRIDAYGARRREDAIRVATARLEATGTADADAAAEGRSTGSVRA